MTSTKFPLSEDELQSKVAELIKDDSLRKLIKGVEELENRIKGLNSDSYLPDFSIDFLVDYKYNEAALKVYKSLFSLELITGDVPRNISLKKYGTGRVERLFPDFVTSNQEKNQFVLFELKKDSQTEREAITELLAYALELKNHLPNIADGDILLVVIANDYDTLLDHAIISLVLGTHFNVLALKTEYTDDLKLSIHYPKAWTDIWQNKLPPEVFSSITLVPYNRDKKNDIPAPMILLDALGDIILHAAVKVNSHGFYIAWQNCASFDSDASFCISIYQFNPFVFLNASIENGFVLNKEEPLSQYIIKHNEDWGESVYPESMMEIFSAAKDFLDQYYTTSIEDFSSWTYHSNLGSNFRSQAWPLLFNSWGNLGDFIRKFFYHPSIRNGFFNKSELETAHMHRSPMFGVEMINRISNLSLFTDGCFRPSGLYFFAKQLREYNEAAKLYLALNKEEVRNKLPRLYFAAIDVLASTREINHRINSATNIDTDDIPSLPIYLSEVEESVEEEIKTWYLWFVKNFLKDHELYQSFVLKSFDLCIIYLDTIKDQIERKVTDELTKDTISFCKAYLNNLLIQIYIDGTRSISEQNQKYLQRHYFNEKELKFDTEEDVSQFIETIPDSFWLESFETIFLELMDRSLAEVYHTLSELPLSIKEKDWSILKSRAIQRYKEGKKYMAISISPSGNITINQLPEDHRIFSPISNPETEIFLEMNEGGIKVVKKVTWAEVELGEVFFNSF